MTNKITTTRSMRVENEATISGSETQEVDAFDDIDIEIPAATLWPGVDVGLAAIYALQAQAILLDTDQDCQALFLGPPINIEATLAINVGVEANIAAVGDFTDEIFPGDIILIEGTVADDGVYAVGNEAAYPVRDAASVVFPGAVAGQTDFFLASGHEINTVAAVAPGTIRKIISVQRFNPKFAIAVCTAGPPGTITFIGDLTEELAIGDYFEIRWGTDTPPGKDGIHLIEGIAYAAPDTTITLPAAVPFLDATNDGDFSKTKLAIDLAANVPHVWTKNSGHNNPLQGDHLWTATGSRVDELRIINAGATAANLNVRLARDVSLP